jgi:hypothetical protein
VDGPPGFDDQDFFEVDPVRYASALGEAGLAAYRDAVGARRDGDSFAARYARERLAILDHDVDAVVRLLGGDLTTPYHFIRVAEAMRELGLDHEALAWAKRGIAQTSGSQVSKLYDLACDVQRGDPLRCSRCGARSTSGCRRHRPIARCGRPPRRLTPGRSSRTRRARRCSADVRGFVDALLGDDEVELAWSATTAAPQDALGSEVWLRLAERSERDRPADALAVYQRIADEVLERADRRAYRAAARILERAQVAAQAAGQLDAFAEYLAELRERYRRRPTLIAILGKADLR